MQTFLPFDNYLRTAVVLDRQRLGKQRVEAWQIFRCLTGLSSQGWANHPATKMWAGYENELVAYGIAICQEWRDRGYRDSLLSEFVNRYDPDIHQPPPWMGDKAFHLSHRSNLLRKLPEHYKQYWRRVPDDLPYVWPTKAQPSGKG